MNKVKATNNKAKDIETDLTKKRKDIAAELGEITLEVAEKTVELKKLQQRANELGTALKELKDNGKRD